MNSKLLKIGALLAVSVMAWVSLTSMCNSCPDYETVGQVCFTLAPTCPAGTELCMVSYDCHDDQNGQEQMYAIDTTCGTALGGTYQVVSADVTVGGITTTIPLNFTQLWEFAHGGSHPSASDLDGMTCAEAETWYDQWVTLIGGTHGTLTCIDQTYTSSPICHTKMIDQCANYTTGISDAERFGGWVKFPDGKTCPIMPVSLEDEVSGCECCNSNYAVRLAPGCSECN